MPVTVFGDGAVQTAYVSFTALDITPNSITLVWPTSYFDVPSVVGGIHYDVLAASMTVTNGNPNTHTITLPDATESSVGSNFIITNIGASDFRLLKSDGSELIEIPEAALSNSYWVQLIDNSTAAGIWQFLQFGAGTSQAQASSLAGNGLVALGSLLNTNIAVKSINAAPYDVLIPPSNPNDRAKLLLWKTGTGVMNLPPIGGTAGYYISLNNEGTGTCTVTPTGGVTIDNNPSVAVSPGQSLSIISDGTDWWTLGFGQNTNTNNFPLGSAIAPSITFAGHGSTGIYYYQDAVPTPPGIGFSVNGVQIANMNMAGLYMTTGKSIIIGSAGAAQTKLSTNNAFGQLSWDSGLTNPPTLNISGTNTDSTITLGPFGTFSISQSATNSTIGFNGNNFLSIDNTGESTFSGGVIFNNGGLFLDSCSFDAGAVFLDTVSMSPPLSIISGGTGQSSQQSALNALMTPGTAALGDLIYYDATNNWVRLPIGTAGQFLKVVGGIPAWAP